jgi:hypothetical protein
MTMKTALIAGVPLAALAALAGCNKSPGVDLKNAKPKEVASAVNGAGGPASFIRPGKWVTASHVTEANMPGMPPAIAERMKQAMSRTTSHESCITEADVKKPKEDFFAGNQKDCTYDHFTMSGGTLDTKMTCKSGGGSMTMAMAGTYSADHYTAHTTMSGTGMGPGGGEMMIKADIEAKRVGECTKAEEEEDK